MAQTNSIQIFQYNGSPITFQMGDCVMVNATEMAKPFGKNASHWLRNDSTKEFITELAPLRNRKGSDLVQVANGVGCFMHEDVAMEFARWLHPGFAIWCNDRIKELLKHGITATEATIENILSDPANTIKILQALQTEREEKAKLQLINNEKQQTIDRQQGVISIQAEQLEDQSRELESHKPILEIYDRLANTKGLLRARDVAALFGMSSITFNRTLAGLGIQYKQGGTWFLYAHLRDKGYTVHKVYQIEGHDKEELRMLWTAQGRIFVYELFKKHNLLPKSMSN